MTDKERFLFGCLGSAGAELLSAYNGLRRNPGDLQKRYKSVPYLVFRALLVAFAGGLAVAYDIDNKVLCVQIGASTPLILDGFASKRATA